MVRKRLYFDLVFNVDTCYKFLGRFGLRIYANMPTRHVAAGTRVVKVRNVLVDC
jgi:hypothetical protein